MLLKQEICVPLRRDRINDVVGSVLVNLRDFPRKWKSLWIIFVILENGKKSVISRFCGRDTMRVKKMRGIVQSTLFIRDSFVWHEDKTYVEVRDKVASSVKLDTEICHRNFESFIFLHKFQARVLLATLIAS